MNQPPKLCEAFRKRLDAFASELPAIKQGSVEALHRARVASRRLRELLPLLALSHETSQELRRGLRRVTKLLGIVRELDVVTFLIAELQRSRRFQPIAIERVGAAVANARAAARKRLLRELATRKVERLVERLNRAGKLVELGHSTVGLPDAGPRSRGFLWALDARLVRRSAAVRNAIDVVGTGYSLEHLHNVRIALKKLRYAAELSQEAGRRRFSADVSRLKGVQDELGRLHDFAVLLDWGRAAQASLSPPDVATWRQLGLLVHAIEDDCRQMHARYMEDRDKLIAITHRMGGVKPHSRDRTFAQLAKPSAAQVRVAIPLKSPGARL